MKTHPASERRRCASSDNGGTSSVARPRHANAPGHLESAILNVNIDRRGFLAALAAAGAAIALPGPITEATPDQIDHAWNACLQAPWIFAVINDSGTIVDPAVAEPRLRSDVFGISVALLQSPERLVREVDNCDPLRGCFEALASDELDDLQRKLEEESEELSRQERLKLRRLAEVLQDEIKGWSDWVLLEGKAGLPRFREAVERWLAEPINWEEAEWFPKAWGGQGTALRFFEQMNRALRDEIGVTIVEGDHPGSSYFAAELQLPITDANHVAQRLGLPIRFRDDT